MLIDEPSAFTGGDVAAAMAKHEAMAARLALLFHLIQRVDSDSANDKTPVMHECEGVVSVSTSPEGHASDCVQPARMVAGIAVAKWFSREVARVYSVLRESSEEREARQLLEFITSQPRRSIKVRDLQRAKPRLYATAEAAECALRKLVRQGHGTWEDFGPGPKGGRPSRIFRLGLRVDDDKTS